jgi:hypothetical protein
MISLGCGDAFGETRRTNGEIRVFVVRVIETTEVVS